jgi:hypothetical protein
MAAGISIGVAADTRAFSQGVKSGVIDPLEDVADALKDVDKGSDKAGDALVDSMKGAQKETKELGGDYEKLADTIRQSSKSASRNFKDSQSEGIDGAKEGLEDFKSESASTARESAASFDGSAESIIGSFQEVAANAFAGFGPAGAVAGLAAAAGIGLISAAIQQGGDDAEALKEKVANLTTELIDNGRRGSVSVEYLSSAIKDLATETDDSKTSLKDLSDVADRSGSSFGDLAEAYAGNADGLKDLWREGKKRLDQLREEADAVDTTTNAGVKAYEQLIKQSDAQDTYVGYLGKSIGVSKEAAEAQENYARAGGPELEQKAAIIEGLASEVDEAAGSWEDYQNKETGAIDVAGYLANFQARIDANNNYVANLDVLKAQMTPEAFAQVIAGGPDLAPLIDSVVNASPEIQGQFAQTYANAAAQANGELAAIDPNVDVKVSATADVKPATADLFRVKEDKSYVTTIGTKADTKPAEGSIKGAAEANYKATISVQADLSDFNTDVNAAMNKSRTVYIDVVERKKSGDKQY